MVLVDTSVWIRFLANRMPYAAELERLLERDEAAGHDLVYGELLIGDSGGRTQLLNSYGLIHRVPAVGHADVAAFVRSRKLHGRGVGWIDAHLLASALVADSSLWTADEHLATLASELGIAYRSRRP
jgi:hypothetical protein